MKTKFFFASLVAATGMLVSCNKEMTPSVQNTEEAAPMTKAYGDKTPIVMTYIETNDTNPLNAGDYFDEDGEPFFDIVELFASNIHKETVGNQVRPTLYLNDKLTPVLETVNGVNGALKYVKPLQDIGIKVLLTVLGDWQGIGVANMDETQADQFATILAYAVEKYNLDGIGFDDEYADYSGYVSGSFGNIITKLRAKLPAGKLITVFNYGNTDQINSAAGALIDYAYTDFAYWNGTPGISGVAKAKWAPSAYNLGSSQAASLVRTYATKAKNEGYGAIMNFNLRRSSEKNPMSTLQAISDGIGCGQLSCNGGDRARDAGSVSTGYTLTYTEATSN